MPCVFHLPGGPAGVNDTLVSAASIHPTLCELAGVGAPTDDWAAAGSVAPLLRGENYDAPDMVVVVSEYGGARMITDGRWKYVARYEGPDELYDRQTDPAEQHNLAAQESARAAELRVALDTWFETRQRGDFTAYQRTVRGRGQLRPVSAARSDGETYAQTPTQGKLSEGAPRSVLGSSPRAETTERESHAPIKLSRRSCIPGLPGRTD